MRTLIYHDNQQLDAQIRLFQDGLQVLILRRVTPEPDHCIMPASLRAWIEDLSVLTGLPAAVGAQQPASDTPPAPLPSLRFVPTAAGMRELRAAHRTVRHNLASASTTAAATEARRMLAVLVQIGRGLRDAGLWPSYVAAARADARGGKR